MVVTDSGICKVKSRTGVDIQGCATFGAEPIKVGQIGTQQETM